jgi:hypothetical protein
MKISLFVPLLFMLTLFLNPLAGFAQCSGGSVVFSENFNSHGTTSGTDCTGGPGVGQKTSNLPAGQTKGFMGTGCAGAINVTDNTAECTACGACNWKTGAVGVNGTGNGGGAGNYAMVLDPCGTSTYAYSTVWCTSISVSAGDIFDFSAYYSSPWLDNNDNNPGLWFSINGVQISPTAIVDEYDNVTPAVTPYNLQRCTYTIPSGAGGSVSDGISTGINIPSSGSVSVSFCIGISQTANNISYGCPTCASGGGNDFLIDDIVIRSCGSGTTNACSYTGTVLPVRLISFDATRTSTDKTLLQWVSASEENSSYFSVEKSADAVNFTEIGTVNAQGTSSNFVSYEFEDNHFNESSYYRLKMVDKDGTFKYSTLTFLKNDISVRVISSLDNKGELQINAIVNEDARWNLAVYSLLGQEYLNEKVSLVKGENTILKGISGGEQSAKIVRITDEYGSVILSEVVVW